MGDIDSFVFWNALRWEKETSYYYEIIDTWKSMLEDTQLTEHHFLNFLSKNAGFFLHNSDNALISISELELGADYRVDFVVCHDFLSYGFEYEFIEIESPTDAVYTRKGSPSARLIEAYSQIQKWRLWIEANRAEAKRILPSKSFIYFDAPYFKYTIIIGRRKETAEFLHLRNQFGKDVNIEIRSFDYLTDKLLARQHFSVTPSIQSEDFKQLDFKIRNELANPFAEAFKSSVWREMTRSGILCDSHMIAKNAEVLLSKRTLNDAMNDFLDYWFSLDLKKRQRLLEEAKMYNL